MSSALQCNYKNVEFGGMVGVGCVHSGGFSKDVWLGQLAIVRGAQHAVWLRWLIRVKQLFFVFSVLHAVHKACEYNSMVAHNSA